MDKILFNLTKEMRENMRFDISYEKVESIYKEVKSLKRELKPQYGDDIKNLEMEIYLGMGARKRIGKDDHKVVASPIELIDKGEKGKFDIENIDEKCCVWKNPLIFRILEIISQREEWIEKQSRIGEVGVKVYKEERKKTLEQQKQNMIEICNFGKIEKTKSEEDCYLDNGEIDVNTLPL